MATVISSAQLRKQERRLNRRLMLRQPGLLAAVVVVIAALLLFSFYPLVQVFLNTVWTSDGLELEMLSTMLSSSYFWRSFGNSVLLGTIVGVLSTVIGFVYAFAVVRTRMPGRKLFDMAAMFPIISPPFVMALALILLGGRSGLITRGLLGIRNANIYGLQGPVIVQTLALFPLAYLNIKGVLESTNTAVEDAAQSMGAGRWYVFRTVTLPLCVPAIMSSFLIVFIKSISDFGNPQVLEGEFITLSSQAYLQINGLRNTRFGAMIALSILIPALIAFVIQKYWVSKKSFVSVTGKPTRGSGAIRDKKVIIPLFIVCGLFTLTIVAFYAVVIWISLVPTWGADMSFSLQHYVKAFASGGRYFKDSVTLSLIATPISALLGMFVAYLIVRKNFFGKRLMQSSTVLTFAVPGIVLGISYVLAFNSQPLKFTGTAFILVVTLVFRTLSIGVEAGTNSLAQVDASIEEASTNLGADAGVTFRRISLPLMRSALFVALINSFCRAMTSISAIIFLVSFDWSLLTILIMAQVESNNFGLAAAYCVILMAIVTAAFAVIQIVMGYVDRSTKRRMRDSE